MDYNYMEDPNKKVKREKTTSEKVGKLFVDWIVTFMLIIVSTVWIFYGFFKPTWSNVPIWVKLAGSVVSIFVAILIASLMGLNGITKAYKLKHVRDLQNEHRKAVDEANEYAEYADEWSEFETKAAYKRARTHLLSTAGLSYKVYFDENGEFTGEKIPTPFDESKELTKQHKLRIKKLNESISLKLKPQTFAAISTGNKVEYDEFDYGDTPEDFHKISTARKALSKVAVTAVMSLVTFEIIKGTNWLESLFNGAIQLMMFLTFGTIEYIKNYNYVTGPYVDSLMKKIMSAKRLIEFGKLKRGEENGNELQRHRREPEKVISTDEGLPITTSTISI